MSLNKDPSDRSGPHNMWNDLIYLSDGSIPHDIELMNSMRFKTIIDLSGGTSKYRIPENCQYVRIEIDDLCTSDILSVVDEGYVSIDDCVSRKERILIHCAMGASRSATLIICWLMTRQNMSLKDALNYCKKRRHAVRPNNGFFVSLQKLEKDILGRSESMPLDQMAYTIWCLKNPEGDEPSCSIC